MLGDERLEVPDGEIGQAAVEKANAAGEQIFPCAGLEADRGSAIGLRVRHCLAACQQQSRKNENAQPHPGLLRCANAKSRHFDAKHCGKVHGHGVAGGDRLRPIESYAVAHLPERFAPAARGKQYASC